MCPEMSKREQRCLGGHLISLDKIGAAEWLGDKGKGRRKTCGSRREMCVRRYRAVLAAKRVRAYELKLPPRCSTGTRQAWLHTGVHTQRTRKKNKKLSYVFKIYMNTYSRRELEKRDKK